MAVRSCMIRPVAGRKSIATMGVAALAFAGSLAAPPSLAAPANWEGADPGSVLVQPSSSPESRVRAPAAHTSAPRGVQPRYVSNQVGPRARVISDRAASEPFDPVAESEGVVAASPDDAAAVPYEDGYGPTEDGETMGQYDAAAEGGVAVPFDAFNGGYEQGPAGGHCDAPGCQGDCPNCRSGACGDPAWRFNANCEPPGLVQKLLAMCGHIEDEGLWTGRADALILSRNAPSYRPLYVNNTAGGANALNANQLQSLVAVGPRLSLFRRDAHHCDTSWEGTYLYSGSFVAQKTLQPALPPAAAVYDLAPPGIYGVLTPNPNGGLDSATARLVGSLQSAELNRRWALGSCAQMLAGFRWIQWQESLAISDTYGTGSADFGQDFYNTNCVNDLYGGQIGLDTLLWQPAKCFRVEGLLKAGAYYNNAVQNSSLSQPATPFNNSVSVGLSPATCSFAGELGFTGVVPVCCNWDFRFSYFGLWLTSIAQPSNQLSGQQLVQGPVTTGSLTTNGSVILQGLSLGLEGRW